MHEFLATINEAILKLKRHAVSISVCRFQFNDHEKENQFLNAGIQSGYWRVNDLESDKAATVPHFHNKYLIERYLAEKHPQRQKELFGDLPTVEEAVMRYCRDRGLT
jgi:hypothetical protein